MACDGYTKVWDLAPGELVHARRRARHDAARDARHAVDHAGGRHARHRADAPATRSRSTAAA